MTAYLVYQRRISCVVVSAAAGFITFDAISHTFAAQCMPTIQYTSIKTNSPATEKSTLYNHRRRNIDLKEQPQQWQQPLKWIENRIESTFVIQRKKINHITTGTFTTQNNFSWKFLCVHTFNSIGNSNNNEIIMISNKRQPNRTHVQYCRWPIHARTHTKPSSYFWLFTRQFHLFFFFLYVCLVFLFLYNFFHCGHCARRPKISLSSLVVFRLSLPLSCLLFYFCSYYSNFIISIFLRIQSHLISFFSSSV